MMQRAPSARAFLQRLHPWLGKAVHRRWTRRRALYQSEVDALLMALAMERGPMSEALRLRVQGFLGQLHREWFPKTWRRDPTYAEVLSDFRWWLGVAERWAEAPARTARRRRAALEPVADQPGRLLRILGLPPGCPESRFQTTWRRYLKAHHPDLNPHQTPEERQRFATAVGLWRR